MYRAMLFALVVGLVAVSVASADLPPPPDQKIVTPKVRFDGLDKQADYVFFLKYKAGNGNHDDKHGRYGRDGIEGQRRPAAGRPFLAKYGKCLLHQGERARQHDVLR